MPRGHLLWTVEFNVPALEGSSNAASTHTCSGLSTGGVLIFKAQDNSAIDPAVNIVPTNSTADELRLTFQNTSGSTITAGSTTRGVLMQFKNIWSSIGA